MVHATGLGTHVQECVAFSHVTNRGNGQFKCVRPGETFLVPKDCYVRSIVKVNRLDDLFSGQGRHVIVIKMDTEGFEPHVVAGGPNLFQNAHVPFVFSEFTSEAMVDKGCDVRAFLESFARAGYYRIRMGSQYYTVEEAMNFSGIVDIVFEHVAAAPSAASNV